MKDTEKGIFAETKGELSKIVGISERHITNLVKQGAPVKLEIGYNTAEWVKWLIARSKAKEETTDSLFSAARLKYRQEKANIAELERKTLQGKLVDRKQYMEAEIFRLTELSQTFRRLPSSVSARVANKSASEVQAIIDAEVRRILKYFENLYSGKIEPEKQAENKVGRKTKIEKASKKE